MNNAIQYQPFTSFFGPQSCAVCHIELTDEITHPVSDEGTAYCIGCAEHLMVLERFAFFFEAVSRVAEQRIAEKKANRAAKKQANLTIKARGTFKATGVVLYAVEDRNGKQAATYHVTAIAGRVTACNDAKTGETCSGRRWSGHCCHGDRVMQCESARIDADPVAASDLPVATIPADDMPAHVEDSIESHEFDWIDAERAAWAKMTPDQRRAAYSQTFDLSYGDSEVA